MATITSAQAGDFNDTATWVGGVVPGALDNAVAAHTVTFDVDATCIDFRQTGTGKFVLGNGRTITGNVLTNVGTRSSGGTVEATMTAGNTAYIVGNVQQQAGSTLNQQAGVVITGGGTLDITGAVLGSDGNVTTNNDDNSKAAVFTNTTCSVVVSGRVVGGNGNRSLGIYFYTNAVADLTVLSDNINAVGGGAGGSACDGVYIRNTVGRHTVDISGGRVVSGAASAFGLRVAGESDITIVGNVQGSGGNSAIGCWVLGSTSIVTITGNVFGGSQTSSVGLSLAGASVAATVTGNIVSGTSTSCFGAQVSNSSSLTVVGNVQPQTFGGDAIVANGNGSSVTVVGNVDTLSGNRSILASGTNATVSVTGTVTGSPASPGGYAIYASGSSSSVSIVGDVYAGEGTTGANGVRADSIVYPNGVTLQGSMYGSQYGTRAVFCSILRVFGANLNSTIRFAEADGFPDGGFVYRVSPDLVTGMPSQADVRSGATYGYLSELTGSLAVPPASSVADGVPVDNTTGTAALSLGDVAALVGAQIAAAVTPPTP
jgi:hypothetical protein